MTSDFDSYNPEYQSEHQPSLAGIPHSSSRSLDVMQRDRFELLSAYMDGEVTADERRQVESWLENDPTVQRLYDRLLKLRNAFQTMPIPTANQQEVQHTVNAVFARVERRPRLALIWGGIAVAAVAVTAVATTLLGERSPIPQIARSSQGQVQPSQPSTDAEPLLVALDKPLVSIPENSVPSTNSPAPANGSN